MDYQHDLLLFQTVTPLHVGCGQDVGVVDLPVIRERTTGYPFLPGSGVRGSLRSRFESIQDNAELAKRYFGPEAEDWKEDSERYAGSVAVHDAKLLLLPVRSDRELFLWITCPAILSRFAREREVFTPGAALPGWRPAFRPGEDRVLGPASLRGGELHLEEIAFTLEATEPQAAGDGEPTAAEVTSAATAKAAQAELESWTREVAAATGLDDLAGRTVLVSDEVFGYFSRHATLIQQHNRLTAAKTVEGGGLFSVEAVPPEAIFYGFLGATASRWPDSKETPKQNRGEILAVLREKLTAPPNSPAPEEPVPPNGPQVGTEHAGAGVEGSGAAGARNSAGGAISAVFHFGGGESTGLGVTRVTWAGGGG